MDITIGQLLAQYDSAVTRWPFFHDAERWFSLPYQLAFAQASRETNMTNELGDGGDGHGVFQLDDRFHVIPSGFDSAVYLQTQMYAEMMASLVRELGTVWGALVAYNSGDRTGNDWTTAHHDYAADVLARCQILQAQRPAPVSVRMFLLTTPYMRGDDIRFFQGACNVKRFRGSPIPVDGIYGPDTALVVRDFQADQGLTVDGIVGPQTLARMSSIQVP